MKAPDRFRSPSKIALTLPSGEVLGEEA